MNKAKSLMMLTATILLLAVMLCVNVSAAEWVDLNNSIKYSFDEDTSIMIIRGDGIISAGLFGVNCKYHYIVDDCEHTLISEELDEYLDFDDYISENWTPKRIKAYEDAQKTKIIMVEEGISIAGSAFCNFKNLEIAVLSDGLTNVPDGAFCYLDKLQTVVLPGSVDSIGEAAFYGCRSLKNMVVPEGVKSIGESAFLGCNKNSIIIPVSVENLGERLFAPDVEIVVASKNDESVKMYVKAEDSFGNLCSGKEYYLYDSVSKKYTKIGEESGYFTYSIETGEVYNFSARAYIEADTQRVYSNYSDIVTISTKVAAPSKVTATQNTSAIELTWTASSGADGYRIFYKSGGKWKTTVSSTTALSHTFNNLKAGAKYTFAIQPYIKTASGVVWGEHVEYTASTVPSTPTVKVTAPSKGKVSVNWNAVNGAEAYQLYYKKGNGSYVLYKTYNKAGTLTFSNLKSGTKYTFAVRAVIKTDGGNVRSGYKEAAVTVK